MFTKKPVDEFLRELASATPVPGGGSVAALSGALAAGLISMVCNLTIGKRKYRDVETEMAAILGEANGLRGQLLDLLEADTQVYSRVAEAYRLPRDTEEERKGREETIQAALIEATRVPMQTARLCGRIIQLCPPVVEKGNVNAVSDGGVAVLLAEAALHSALMNVRINLASLTDAAAVRQFQEEMDALIAGKAAIKESVVKQVQQRLS